MYKGIISMHNEKAMKRYFNDKALPVIIIILAICCVATIVSVPIISWGIHIYTCFTAGLWGFLIAGALFFPIGIIHGFGIMLGIW